MGKIGNLEERYPQMYIRLYQYIYLSSIYSYAVHMTSKKANVQAAERYRDSLRRGSILGAIPLPRNIIDRPNCSRQEHLQAMPCILDSIHILEMTHPLCVDLISGVLHIAWRRPRYLRSDAANGHVPHNSF